MEQGQSWADTVQGWGTTFVNAWTASQLPPAQAPVNQQLGQQGTVYTEGKSATIAGGSIAGMKPGTLLLIGGGLLAAMLLIRR